MAQSSNQRISNLISEIYNDDNLRQKFIRFADKQLNKITKKRYARHRTAPGIVSEVAAKLIMEKFVWNMEKYTLNTIFYFRINSEIYNMAKKEKYCIPVPWEKYEGIDENFEDYIDTELDKQLAESRNKILSSNCPIDLYKDKLEGKCVCLPQIKAEVFRVLKDSPLEYEVAEKVFKFIKSKEIAKTLGISTDQVHNIKRRIYRIARSLYTPDKNKEYKLIYEKNQGGFNVYIF